MEKMKKIKSGLIVSCQALEDEPLHSPFIMGKMALAAFQGGAKGIRANGISDIQTIKKEVDLPLIGIIKKDYDGYEVRITPTRKEIDELYKEGVDIIAFDGTKRLRPNDIDIKNFMKTIRDAYPHQLFMADVSNLKEAQLAYACGMDFVATTLVGYTPYTQENDSFETLKEIIQTVPIPVLAEGRIQTPQQARHAIKLGAYAVVVGSAITRPQLITKLFSDSIEN